MGVESMRCRNCGASLEAGRVDPALGVVSCGHCGGLHELPERGRDDAKSADTGAGSAATPAPVDRGVVALPRRFDVHRGQGALQVRWSKGNKVGAIIIAVFALVWGFLTASSGVFLLVPVSLVLLYVAAVKGLNRTTFRVDERGLSVRQGPLPTRGAKRDMARTDIAQLFANERITRTRMDSGSDTRRVQEHRSYALQAIDRGGRKRVLIGGLSSPDQALWLEREAEALLGIDDAVVAGEVR